VYFDVARDADYGKLCNRDPAQLEAGARIEISDKKRNPGDFALWKGAKPGEPSWPSAWGPGRPGWHIECSAMSMKLLGETLDIHGGGLDLQFPHHENELAQSESLTDQPFARYWMHNGLMKTGDQKMSKSAGNEIVVSEVLKKHAPETLRFLLLSTHYRSPIEYSEKRLVELGNALQAFERFFERYQDIRGHSFQEIEVPWRHDDFDPTWAVGQDWDEVMAIRQRFLDCMDDDFNTGGAVGTLFELVNLLNRFVEKKQLQGAGRGTPVTNIFGKCTVVLRELTLILGLFIEKRRSRVLRVAAGVGKSYTGELLPWAELPHRQELTAELLKLAAEVAPGQLSEDSAQTDIIALILQLVARRNEARKAKDFATGDRIRGRLKELGILLEDKGGETDVRIEEAQRI
jgi:cysteinyl-tRNA synthetase